MNKVLRPTSLVHCKENNSHIENMINRMQKLSVVDKKSVSLTTYDIKSQEN